MVNPETCGAAGGAVSLWVNISECTTRRAGIITTRNTGAGFDILQLPPQVSPRIG